MYLNVPKNPSKLKKTVYLVASTILGVLLSFLAHALIEIKYLHWLENQSKAVTFYHGCAFLPVIQIAFVALGAVGGFFLGRFWWRKIYIERVWAKK
jgi:hypothetical protein